MSKVLFIEEFPDLAAEWVGNVDTLKTLSRGSDFNGQWKCPQGHYYEARVYKRSQGRGCPYCANKSAWAGFNDLATLYPESASMYSSENVQPLAEVTIFSQTRRKWKCAQGHTWQLAPCHQVKRKSACNECAVVWVPTTHPIRALWDRENERSIDTVSIGNSNLFLFRCSENHQWSARFVDVFQGKSGCPVCSNRKTISGVNDLASLHPHLVAQWSSKNETSPAEVNAASRRKAWWKCAQGHEWKAEINSRQRVGCPVCSNRTIHAGVNDLKTRYPHLYKEVVHKRATLSPGSKRAIQWKCSACSFVYRASMRNRVHGANCPRCYPGSQLEREVADFVERILPGVEVLRNVRNVIAPKELDVYVPSLKIAIEFNGLYWHSDAAGKGRQYHRQKYLKCADQGIQLIQIWEDEWRDKQEVVKALLRSKLGVDDRERVFARKTVVHRVDKQEAKAFLDECHIQGFAGGSHYLGLRTREGELVSVMVLRKLRDELYLDRYATSKHVIGGQSKLLKWVHENLEFSRLVTFADLQVSNGGLYETTGWTKDRVLNPDYRYLVDSTRVHKFNYRLKRFQDDPELKWQEGLTERELAVLNGLPRVWDSGKIRYVMAKERCDQ